MITIEKEQLETLRAIVSLLGILVGILTTIIPAAFTLLFWYIRKLDVGGKRRLKEQSDSFNTKLITQRLEFQDVINIQALQIATLEDTIEILKKRVGDYEAQIDSDKNTIQKHLLRIRQLEDEVKKITDEFEKKARELMAKNDETRASTILMNASKLVIAFGLSDNLAEEAVNFLEGKITVEEFVEMVREEVRRKKGE